MRPRNLISALAAAVMMPSIAFAAEGAAEEPGSWLTLLFFAINFTLFVILLVHYALPPARNFFRERARGIRSDLDRLDSALRQAQDYADRAAAEAAKLQEEISRITREVESETAFQVGRIREGASSTAERIRRDTGLTASAIADAAQRRVRQRLAATAAHLAHGLIAKSFEPADQGRLIDSFMEKLRQEAAR